MPSLGPIRSVLRNRQFALLWGGQTVSLFGDGIVSVGLPLLVLETTNSAVDLGLVVAARLVSTFLFLLLGGAITDRVSRRLAMLMSDAARAVITAALGIMALSGVLSLANLVAGAILFGTFDALFYPASNALYPELIEESQIIPANSLRQVSEQLAASLLGPIMGGVIASTIGTSWSLVIDSGTFVVSAACLASMRPTPRPADTVGSILSEVAVGVRYCRQTAWIFWTLVVAALANAVVYAPVVVLLPLLFTRTLHAPSWQVGVGFASFGLGGLVGALALATLPRPKRRVRAMWLLWGTASFVTALYGIAPSTWSASVVVLVIGPLLISGQIIWESLLQAEVPGEILGRVSSVARMTSSGLAPVGVAAAGIVAGVVGVRIAIVVPAVAIGVLSFVVLATVRSLTEIDRRPAATADG